MTPIDPHILKGISFIDPTTPIPDDLIEDGNLRLMPCEEMDRRLPGAARMLWCHKHARYGLINAELVSWLRDHIIGERKVIEIGSGHGDLAKHLHIHGTDNKMQERPQIRDHYARSGQPSIQYPAWVEKIDAVAAVRKHKPDVVVASWVTHWIDPRFPAPPGGGNMFGVRENEILDEAVTYVMLGNLFTHEHKPILKRQHTELYFPWLRSRSQQPHLDRIFIWEP